MQDLKTALVGAKIAYRNIAEDIDVQGRIAFVDLFGTGPEPTVALVGIDTCNGTCVQDGCTEEIGIALH